MRPDGVLVGTGAELASGSVRTGPWLNADGLPGEAGDLIWTGSTWPDEVASDENCQDWTTSSPDLSSLTGLHATSGGKFFNAALTSPCSQAHRLYCVEP